MPNLSFTNQISGITYTVLCSTIRRTISCTPFSQTLQQWDSAFSFGVGHKYQRLTSKLLVKGREDNEKPNSVVFALTTIFQNFYRFGGPAYKSRSCACTCTSTRWVVECPHPNRNLSVREEYQMTYLFLTWINSRALTFHIYCSQTWSLSLCFFPRGAICGRDVISALYGAAGIFFNRICPYVFQVHFSSALRQPSHISEWGEKEFGAIRKFVECFSSINNFT